MKDSKISWTDHTFNPWIGCTKVSPGCANCYAAAMDYRWGHGSWGPGAPRRRTSLTNWKQPIKWCNAHEASVKAWAQGAGIMDQKPSRPRVFCASLADWLDDEVPIAWLADLLDLIRRTPNLDWLLLTKRPQNWARRIDNAKSHAYDLERYPTDELYSWIDRWQTYAPPANVWIGTTAEDQTRADERIPQLLRIPAKVRFLSCEPLLGPIDLPATAGDGPNSGFALTDGFGRVDGEGLGIHWVIFGGESGPKARPMHPDWARSLRDQCKAAGVAFFMKQMGGVRDKLHELGDLPNDLRIREFPT